MRTRPYHNFLPLIWALIFAGSAYAQVTFRTVELSGATPPDVPGAEFQRFLTATIGSGGDVAVEAFMKAGVGGVDASNATGIWHLHRGGLVARTADLAPSSAGAQFANFDTVATTDSLAVVFRARLDTDPAAVSYLNDGGIWRWSPDGFRLIARENDPVPDVPGARFLGEYYPIAEDDLLVNAAGEVAFVHYLSGVPADRDTGIFFGDDQTTVTLLREGDPAPGIPGGATFREHEFRVFKHLRLNDVGDVLFSAEVTDPQPTNTRRGLFLRDHTAGVLRDAITHTDADVPGAAAGSRFNSFDATTLNSSQQLAFIASLKGASGDVLTENNAGIWAGEAGDLQLVVRKGTRPAGMSDSFVFQGFDAIGMNDSGMLVFRASVHNPTITTDNTGVWFWSPITRQIEMVMLVGDAPPNHPGREFRYPWNFGINDQGMVTLRLESHIPDEVLSNRTGIYAWRSGKGLVKLVESGDFTGQGGDFVEVAPGDTRQIDAFVGSFPIGTGEAMADGRIRLSSNRAELPLSFAFVGVIGEQDEGLFTVNWEEPLFAPTDTEWLQKKSVKSNTAEAELEVRVGDIDNLGFGWPEGFDPFSGVSTPSHTWPWTNDHDDPAGTDRIIVVSSHTGASVGDGYSTHVARASNPLANQPVPVVLNYDASGLSVTSARLQLFVDDFQAVLGQASYQATINGTRAPFLETAVNRINQTAPVGKLLDLEVPPEFYPAIASGNLSILLDDPTTGTGEGYAIDFIRLLVNPVATGPTGAISGRLTAADGGAPIENARITAAGRETFSDASGNYILRNLPVGEVVLRIYASGYQTATGTITVLASQTTENVNVALPTSTPGPPSDAKILSINFGGPSGDDIEFTFQGVVGSTYSIEKSEDMQQWRTILRDIPGNVNPIMISDPTPRDRSPLAYYRVVNQ